MGSEEGDPGIRITSTIITSTILLVLLLLSLLWIIRNILFIINYLFSHGASGVRSKDRWHPGTPSVPSRPAPTPSSNSHIQTESFFKYPKWIETSEI